MDLHAWITQQVDTVEAAAQAELECRRVVFEPHSGGPAITGIVTSVTQTPNGMQLNVAQYGDEARDDTPAPVQAVAAILRRCEADRRILARHQPQPDGTPGDDGWQCRTCSEDGGDGYQYLVPYPCPTVTDLAHAHGITDDILASLDRPTPPEPQPRDSRRLGLGDIHATPTITTSQVPAALRGPRWKA